jgi:hypothetical protein
MKTIKLMMLMAVLTLAWGCSSDSEGDEEQWNGSTFAPADKPAWAVDWTSTATKPDWKTPDLSKYELGMYCLVELDEELVSHSTDEDVIAMFINGECREVTVNRNRMPGKVKYMLYFKGSSSEVGTPLELHYYCDKLHHMNTVSSFTTFVPNNESSLIKDITKKLHLADGSSKYPVCTQLTVKIVQKLPFTVSNNDQLAVFVGNDCRGVGVQQADGSWQVQSYGVQKGETAQLRYYSAEKTGVYTILKTIKLDGANQQESISF